MRALVVCIAVLFAVSAIQPPDADAISKRRQCKDACGAAIDRCIAQGGKKRKCRRQTLKACRQRGVVTCAVVTTTSTTVRGGTTLPGESTTTIAGGSTTTGPGGSVTTTTGPGGTTTTLDSVHGCSHANATDLRASGAPAVTFQDFQYVPRCILINHGQTITFTASLGSFADHPLTGGRWITVTPEPDNQSPIGFTNSGTSKSVLFTSAGTFPFYCGAHGFLPYAMAGAVFVDP